MMKKSIGMVILMIGMSAMAFAQSDNASALVVRGEGDGSFAGVRWTNVYGVFEGPTTIVYTPGGNATISWTGYLVQEGTEELKTPYKEYLTNFSLYLVWDRLNCQITPGYVAMCEGHTKSESL